MNPSEAAILLARISASDNREVSEASARAWAESLPDVALVDALDYLPTFYRSATRDTKNWIYPGDVLAGVRDMHIARCAQAGIEARQAVLDAADDEYEAAPRAMRAALKARAKYNSKHSVPEPPMPAANVAVALSQSQYAGRRS